MQTLQRLGWLKTHQILTAAGQKPTSGSSLDHPAIVFLVWPFQTAFRVRTPLLASKTPPAPCSQADRAAEAALKRAEEAQKRQEAREAESKGLAKNVEIKQQHTIIF